MLGFLCPEYGEHVGPFDPYGQGIKEINRGKLNFQ